MSKNKITRSTQLMNTTITVSVVPDSAATVAVTEAIEAVFEEFSRIVKRFTRFNEDSELANLNRNSGRKTQVSEELFFLISEMLKLSESSRGAFDPTIIDFLETYGYDSNYNFSKLSRPDLDSMVQKLADDRPSWREIDLDHKTFSVTLAPKQRLDLGGLGKGYAIDRAVALLSPFRNFLIDAGGDLFANGVNENDAAWSASLYHQDRQQKKRVIGRANISDKALACSGSWSRRVKQFHHLINPNTGRPDNENVTVYVLAPTALLADGWATALFVGGKDLLPALPPECGALIVDKAEQAYSFNFPVL